MDSLCDWTVLDESQGSCKRSEVFAIEGCQVSAKIRIVEVSRIFAHKAAYGSVIERQMRPNRRVHDGVLRRQVQSVLAVDSTLKDGQIQGQNLSRGPNLIFHVFDALPFVFRTFDQELHDLL